jgi:anti-sigma factor RsiW
MNQRDLELLSSYLDGQLRPSDSARLERRLSADPDLRSVLDDLRAARGLLRQLPMRKAPRNFTLTPQMVGKKPPLPRAYPAFRFVTALATLLFFVTMGVNFLAPQMAQPAAFGMGGGGAPDVYSAQAPEAAATQAPAATEAPLASMAPMPTPTVAIEAAPAATTLPPAMEDTARAAENPAEKNAPAPYAAQPQDQNGFRQEIQPPVPPAWIILLAGIALFGAVIMLLMRRLAVERWRRK